MYLYGFENHHQSESSPGALPTRQNSPQICPQNLYAEQVSGSAFTRPRHVNLHSWLYREHPSVIQSEYRLFSHQIQQSLAPDQAPNPMRWSPRSKPTVAQDFIHGLSHIASTPVSHTYLYHCTESMQNRYIINRDGEWLFIPYQGGIVLHTEFGRLEIGPGMIAVIPRGIAFKLSLVEDYAAGYLCENSGQPLTLPQLGSIGANGLANPRHFFYPCAAVEPGQGTQEYLTKYLGKLWATECQHSPLNVVAWQGNYAPYAYDLSLFNTIQTVSFDHPDPCIFTVLSSESSLPGVAQLDFVIFPPRWMVAEHTFRPPYFHRNVMSEYMGLIRGEYDGKSRGFEMGGISIHNRMTPHGPDYDSYQKAIGQSLKPEYYANTLAFMLEACDPWQYTTHALEHSSRQLDYIECWQRF